MNLSPIGHMRSPYLTKFGVPRQPGLVKGALSRLMLLDGIRSSDLVHPFEAGDRCVLLWLFSHNVEDPDTWSKTVRPPLLGGIQRVGVFSTRSSFRPNNLALSCVTIAAIDERGIDFQECDLVDGTPVLQVLPYDERAFFFPYASEGWRAKTLWPVMDSVIIPRCELEKLPLELHDDVYQLLRQDPRPAYTRHGQEERVFWVQYDEYVIWFMVDVRDLVVIRIERLDEDERTFIKSTGNLSPTLSSF